MTLLKITMVVSELPIKVEVEVKTKPKLKPKLKPNVKVKAKLKSKAKYDVKHKPQHPSIISTCNCGIIFPKNTINKYFKNVTEGHHEYKLWERVRHNMGVTADEYFSMPITEPHVCEYGLVISFNYAGLELSSPELITKIRDRSDSLELLLEIFKHVARGLDELNSVGIIHLDVKPENIIVDPVTFEAKIIDIGNAQEISKPFNIIDSIDPNNGSILKPTYPYYPPHMFYLESWLSKINKDPISECNLVTDYLKEHRILIKNYYPDNDILKMQLIAIYQRDDPRASIYQISMDKKLIRDYQRRELKTWDVYGLGITIIYTLKLLGHSTMHSIYQNLLKTAIKMSCPNAGIRLTFSDFLLPSGKND